MSNRETRRVGPGWSITIVVLVGILCAGLVVYGLGGESGEQPSPAPDTDTTTATFTAADSPQRRPSAQDSNRPLSTTTGKRQQTDRGAPPAATQETGPVSAPLEIDTIRGTVRRVGAMPFARTIVEGTDTVTVDGNYEPELSRLSGARVEVMGSVETGQYPGPTAQVTEYTILSISGEPPVVGTLRRDSAGFFLRTNADTVRLRAAPPSFAQHVKSKL